MIKDLIITNASSMDIESANQVFELSIPDAFEKEGLGSLKEDIEREVLNKVRMLESTFSSAESDTYFLLAKSKDAVVGTISFGPCGEDIIICTDNELKDLGELGSLYVLPEFQGQGIGSALINALAKELYEQGIMQFCLDSGYKRAQKRWLRKFGAPIKIFKDYWAPGTDHFIWKCNVIDFI